MMTNHVSNAAAIAAQIDTTTVDGHNLRALLLRLLAPAGPDWGVDFHRSAMADAERMGLVGALGILTPLGRDVAELLRPVPWRLLVNGDAIGVRRPDGSVLEIGVNWTRTINDWNRRHDDAERIAKLFTADDLDKAKRYRIT